MTFDLFQDMAQYQAQREELCDGAVILRGFALENEAAFSRHYGNHSPAPFRHMVTPGGFRMSVAMTNCGSYGWVTDRNGYRYDPTTRKVASLAPHASTYFLRCERCRQSAGFEGFHPDACLVNRYDPEQGIAASGQERARFQRAYCHCFAGPSGYFSVGRPAAGRQNHSYALIHGDVMVWGGPARLRYHGVLPVKEGTTPRPAVPYQPDVSQGTLMIFLDRVNLYLDLNRRLKCTLTLLS